MSGRQWWIYAVLGALAVAGALYYLRAEREELPGPDTIPAVVDPEAASSSGDAPPGGAAADDDAAAQLDALREQVGTLDGPRGETLSQHTTPRFTRHEPEVREFDPDDLAFQGSPAGALTTTASAAGPGAAGIGAHPLDNPQATGPVTGDGPLGPSGVPQVNTGMPGPGVVTGSIAGADGESVGIRQVLPGPRGEIGDAGEGAANAIEEMGIIVPGDAAAIVGPAEGPGGSLENESGDRP